ncbi:MAG: hypothetical protein QNJ36_01545 [Calothrix sp. MO_167.B42]|nr:hypothetical protein [Calothrix sp. MO_167.B42]
MIKKPLQAQQSAEEEGEEGNLNNSDTNGNDITQLAYFLVNTQHLAGKKYKVTYKIFCGMVIPARINVLY